MKKLLIIITLITSACTKMYTLQTPYNDADFIPYTQEGSGTISGQVFLKTVGGDVKYGAGNSVMLYPYTPYVQELMQIKSKPRYKIRNEDTGWTQYIKTTTADAEGKFQFKALPAGEYLLESNVFWGVASQYGMQTTGGVVRKNVTLKDGEQLNIMLTE